MKSLHFDLKIYQIPKIQTTLSKLILLLHLMILCENLWHWCTIPYWHKNEYEVVQLLIDMRSEIKVEFEGTPKLTHHLATCLLSWTWSNGRSREIAMPAAIAELFRYCHI